MRGINIILLQWCIQNFIYGAGGKLKQNNFKLYYCCYLIKLFILNYLTTTILLNKYINKTTQQKPSR